KRLFTKRQEDPFEAHRESDRRDIGSAESAQHSIITSTAQDRALRANFSRIRQDLETSAGVIVEPAHQTRIHGIREPECIEGGEESIKMHAIVVGEAIEQHGSALTCDFVALVFRIEDS